MNVLLKRKENLKIHLTKDHDLLKEYEDKLRLEDDPSRKSIFTSKIEEIKEQIQSRETELDEISHRLRRSETTNSLTNLQAVKTEADTVTFGSMALAAPHSDKKSAKFTDQKLTEKFAPPSAIKDFVGREDIIDDISKIPAQTRFVSINGISGIGKSSLLKQLAAVNDAMTNGVNVGKCRNFINPRSIRRDPTQNHFNRRTHIFYRFGGTIWSFPFGNKSNNCRTTDAFDLPVCQPSVFIVIDKI